MRPTFVAFDTETTGLDPLANEICEIAGVKFQIGEDGRPKFLGKFESLVAIQGSCSPLSSAINHIYDSDLVGAPEPEEVLHSFFRWVGPSAIMLAHHAAFDVAFIGQAIKRHSLMVPRNPTFCTKRIAIRLVAGRHRLQDLEAKLISKDPEWMAMKAGTNNGFQQHRAAYDCYMLAYVFTSMSKLGILGTTIGDVRGALDCLSHLDGAKRSFDMPMDVRQLQQEMENMKRLGCR